MADDFETHLARIKQAGDQAHDQNRQMIRDHIDSAALVVAQHAAQTVVDAVKQPDFFAEEVP